MTDTTAPAQYDKITEALKGLAQPVTDLKLYPNNYRHGDVELIAQSLVRFGQLKPVVVQESTRFIVAGNHTYKAALGLGWSHIAAAIVDMDDATATAYLLADNHLSDLAENDTVQLASLLQETLNANGQMALVGTGYDETRVSDLADLAFALTNTVVPTEPFSGDYAEGHPVRAADIVPESEEEERRPMREIVLLLEVQDARLMGRRARNLQKLWPDGGLTVTVMRAVARAHEAEFGTADPDTVTEEPPAVTAGEAEAPPSGETPPPQETFEASGAAPTTEPTDLPGE